MARRFDNPNSDRWRRDRLFSFFRNSIFVACSRKTKWTRVLFLNYRNGHECRHFEASLDGYSNSTAFKTWCPGPVQEPQRRLRPTGESSMKHLSKQHFPQFCTQSVPRSLSFCVHGSEVTNGWLLLWMWFGGCPNPSFTMNVRLGQTSQNSCSRSHTGQEKASLFTWVYSPGHARSMPRLSGVLDEDRSVLPQTTNWHDGFLEVMALHTIFHSKLCDEVHLSLGFTHQKWHCLP